MPGVKESCRTAAGFTLIELMTVIVISSVLIGVASPQLSRFYRNVKIDAAARQIKMFLDNARGTALSEKQTCRVTVAPGWKRMTLLMRKDLQEGSEEYAVADGRLAKLDMMPEIEIDEITRDGQKPSQSIEVSLDVFPLYMPQAVSFMIKDSTGNRRKVSAEAGSGRVRIEEQ